MKKRLVFVVLGMLALLSPSAAQNNPVRQAQQHVRSAMQAYRGKDYSTSLEHFTQALRLRPDHPTLIYNIAGLNAQLGNTHEALASLERVANMGLVYDPKADGDFVSLNNLQEFHKILNRFETNRGQVGNPAIAYNLTSGDLIAESIAYDPVTRTAFVGTVRTRQILSFSEKGGMKEFSRSGDGLWGIFGMKVDVQNRTLWVCTSALPQMVGYQEHDKSRAAVCKYDIVSGTLIKKYELKDRIQPHLFGDLTLSAEGDVYITDS